VTAFQSQNGLILVKPIDNPVTVPGTFQSQNGLILVLANHENGVVYLEFQSQNGLILVEHPTSIINSLNHFNPKMV